MRTARILFVGLALAGLCIAQGQKPADKPADKNAAAAQAAPAPAGKRPPQAKTQPEFDAYKAAAAVTDPAGLEKAADDFAQKFPDSELRVLLYKQALRAFQNANNSDKMLEMGRKVLAIDGDDPEALIDVAQVLTEKTRDSDVDKEQKTAEALKSAEKAIQTVDTDVPTPPGASPEQIEMFKGFLRSSAYAIIGTLHFNKNEFPKAEENYRKSIDALPSQPDPVTILRLAITLDKQGRYTDALEQANKAVSMTQDGNAVGTAARREQDRLQKLTAGGIQ